MLSVYDLYDLHAILVNIRHYPDYEMNEEILLNVINVLSERQNIIKINQFRLSLANIPSLKEEELYKFVFHNNVYTYFPTILKDDYIHRVLIESCCCLLNAIKEKNMDKILNLSNCLHNLPIYIVENNLSIPKHFWKREVKYYRTKWDSNFLKIRETRKDK
jgi:hypothetical protein